MRRDGRAPDQLRESDEFARLANKEVAAIAAGTPSRGVKQAPFVVLMGVHMPAALVEIGFITNAREEAVLTRAAERDRIAKGLAAAVAEYGRRYDARRGGEPSPSAPAPAAAAAGGGSQ